MTSLFAASSATSTCPAWCRYETDNPGLAHDYMPWDHDGSVGRNHEATFGDVYVAQWELKTPTKTTFDVPVICQTQCYEDMNADQARQHAAELLAAAELYERLAMDATPS